MTGFVSIILLPVRYAMVIGLTVLGLLYYNQLNLSNGNGGVDFERILPGAINSFLPVGILGTRADRIAGRLSWAPSPAPSTPPRPISSMISTSSM
jgi:SSS family solute:Na+ symporter